MTIIPHQPIVWEHVRTLDLLVLLTLGVTTELLLRGLVLAVKKKPASLRLKEDGFFKLEHDTNVLRKKGPSAFVETSKAERSLLAADKELQQLYATRQQQRESTEKYTKYARYFLAAVIFVVYYGVAILSYSGKDAVGSIEVPLFFPLSVAEIGFKWISQWGLPAAEGATSGLGALVIMWSASAFVGQLMEGVECLVLS